VGQETDGLAGPFLVQRIHFIGVGDADDGIPVVESQPRHRAAQPAELTKVGDRLMILPQDRSAGPVRLIGPARNHAVLVDGHAPALGSAE
jgi:hypothetical protein